MRTLPIFFFFIIMCFFTACLSTDEAAFENNTSFEPAQLDSYVTDPHKGVYVNNFEDDILGDFVEETYLLDWCVHHDFNEMTLYTVSSILDDPIKTELLSQFVRRARKDYHVRVTFAAAGMSALNKIEDYRIAYPENRYSPNGVTTEYEFWNPGYNYEYYRNEMLDKMEAIDPMFFPRWKQELYVAKFEDEALEYTDEEVIAETLEHLNSGGGNDQLFWVNYRTNAFNFPNPVTAPTSFGRIQSIANEAYAQGFVVNVVVLFNVRTDSGSPNIYDYFDEDGEGHEFNEAFENYYAGFLASTIEHKESINFTGYQIYRYSNARLARPL